jgi:hypothetical protein
MALKLNERYPGRFDNPSSDYPQGAFKNRTTPTAKDGSYLEKDWANDKEGFFQSLLSEAGVIANGDVDKVGGSQYYDALHSLMRGRLLRTSVYTLIAGVQNVSIDGGAPTPTGAGTFTPLASAVRIVAEGVGGGGGSGATTATGGSQFAISGGASGACYGLGTYPAPAAAIAVSIGLAGVAGAAPGGSGGNGGTTSLGALLSVGGGSGSTGSAAQTGNLVQGGAATAKTVTGANIYSANGGYGHYGISLTSFIGGVGGSTVFGPGGSPGLANTAGTASTGNPATSPGAGGGGSATAPSAAAQPGAKGADGLLIIREYA